MASQEDFCLVIGNAKTFNPPDTLYHVEASKIETWGLEQISRASSQVIEFETDWSLSLDAPATEPTPETEAVEEPPLTETGASSRARSPSVMSSTAAGPGIGGAQGRKLPKGKKVPIVTESWEEGGHLPGFKDGLNAFPPRTQFAALMLELKLRGS